MEDMCILIFEAPRVPPGGILIGKAEFSVAFGPPCHSFPPFQVGHSGEGERTTSLGGTSELMHRFYGTSIP